MEKKKITSKERGKIAGLSILAIISGAGIALSTIAYFGSESNLGALFAFMVSVGICAWSIIKASRIQKAIDDRYYQAQPDFVSFPKVGVFCENCGAEIASDSKFCGACGQKAPENIAATVNNTQHTAVRKCPRCGGHNIQYQTVVEARKAGCGTILLYVILALTVFGLLIVIPLMLRKKTESVTYAVCQNCGNRWKV